jgi:hypothetical protein
LKARDEFIKKTEVLSSEVMKATGQIDQAKVTLDKLTAFAKDIEAEEIKALMKEAEEVRKKLDKMREAFFGPTREGQGIVRNLYPTTMGRQGAPRSYASSSYGAPGLTEERLYQHAKESAEEALVEWRAFFEGDWKTFEEKVKNTRINVFQELEAVEIG